MEVAVRACEDALSLLVQRHALVEVRRLHCLVDQAVELLVADQPIKDEEVEEALAFITGVMSTPPDWAKGLPVACEAGVAKSYGDC